MNPIPEYDATGIKDYVVECNRLGVIPVSYFQRHCHDKAFVMRHHGLGPLGAKAIAKPLEVSAAVANTLISAPKSIARTWRRKNCNNDARA